jgi:transcriptional regulator with XRE-family HTH domain
MGKSVGERIRSLRVDRKLSQEALAKLLGIKQGSLTQLETGKSKAPSSKTLTKLARVFEVDPEWLMTGKGPQQVVSALSEKESELVLSFRQLSEEGQDYILSRVRAIHADEQERRPRRRATDQAIDAKKAEH